MPEYKTEIDKIAFVRDEFVFFRFSEEKAFHRLSVSIFDPNLERVLLICHK
jgi:hypothetical protein